MQMITTNVRSVLYGVQAVTFDLDAGRMTSRVLQPGTPEVISMG